MKTIITVILVFCIITIFGQAPQAINYQAVARDGSNNLLANKNIGIRISIISGSATGTNVYSETHITSTNASGIFSVEIGRGNIVSGNFPNIQWYAQQHFAKIEIDATGGTNYQLVGTSQFLSVPYALFAENTAMIFRPEGIVGNGSNGGDTLIMYQSEIGNIDYISSCIIDWIGGEPEDILVSASGFNTNIYPTGIAFPYTITSSQFENSNTCPYFTLAINPLTPVGIYPLTITGTNPRGRQKSKTTYLQIKDCIYKTEDGFIGNYIGNMRLLVEQAADTTTISNPISNDNKLSFTSKLFNINNIELTKDINNSYVKNGYSMNNVTVTLSSFGTITILNSNVNITVNANCTLQNNIDVKYYFTSGTTNTGLSLSGLSFNGTLVKQ